MTKCFYHYLKGFHLCQVPSVLMIGLRSLQENHQSKIIDIKHQPTFIYFMIIFKCRNIELTFILQATNQSSPSQFKTLQFFKRQKQRCVENPIAQAQIPCSEKRELDHSPCSVITLDPIPLTTITIGVDPMICQGKAIWVDQRLDLQETNPLFLQTPITTTMPFANQSQ